MNLSSVEMEERNAHMYNADFGTRGTLVVRNGVSVEASFIGMFTSPFTGFTSFDFVSSAGEHVTRESDKYWDFTVKAGN